MILCVVYGFSGTTTQQETGDWRGVPRRLSSDTGLIPRAWGQDVGLGDKSYFSMHMSAASIHLASALTVVIQRAFIQKQLCVLRCCCITGSVCPQSQTNRSRSHFLPPAGLFSQTLQPHHHTTTAEPAKSTAKTLKGEEQRGDL